MKSAILVGIFSAAFSCSAWAQTPTPTPTPQERAAADRVQCEEASRTLVVKDPGEAVGWIDKCLQEHSHQRYHAFMEQCQKASTRATRPRAFYKNCMTENGYRYE